MAYPATSATKTTALQAAVEHFGVTGDTDRYELLITHNFVIGWFVRHMLDAPVWRWIGLDQANCAITIVQWDSDRLAGPGQLQRYRAPVAVQVPH